MSAGSGSQFVTTRWSLVELAASPDAVVRREALQELLRRYMAPLRLHLIRRRVPHDLADELLQEFVADKVLEDQLFARADRRRGRFRSFLLTALNNFVSNEARAVASRRRQAGGLVNRPLEEVADPENGPDPGAQFETAWARQVLHGAVELTRAECLASHRLDVWDVFDARVLAPVLDGAQPVPYDELARRTRSASPAAAAHLLTTAKRMFIRNLRAVIAEYEPDAPSIDAEIADLRALLSVSNGRVNGYRPV